MVNVRSRDLDARLARLRAGEWDVDERVEGTGFGGFGRATDAEGRRVEPWEPPDAPPT